MCGLVVFLNESLLRDPVKAMERALKAIQHRGTRTWHDADNGYGVRHGHVRLPIRGDDRKYDMPYQSDATLFSFVGEVLNMAGENDAWELHQHMARHRGYFNALNFRDSLGHGPDGFWAIARSSMRQTTVITDHLSIKPLYWHKAYGIIASELRAIEAAVGFRNLQLDPLYLSNVAKWGYCPSYRTPYFGVCRLKPETEYRFVGEHLHAVTGNPFMLEQENDLRAAVADAVQNRLVSDFPVAVLCSGGLDSTVVALLAARMSEDVTVFYAENLDDARHVEAIRWPSHVKVRPVHLEDVPLADALEATEEPVDLGSVHPQYALGKAVHDAGFRVCVTGDGADELFGGYGRAQVYDSQHSDVFCELVHYHLPRLDKTMMAHQVELRSPYLSPRVLRCALDLPYRHRTKKQALREAFRDLVPQAVLDRPKVPLKTEAVRTGGMEYRLSLITRFKDRFVRKGGRL